MATTDYIRVLKRMDLMIRSKSTGSPGNFARRMVVSERTLYNYIAAMKELGAPIHYSRYYESYIYNEDGGLVLEFEKFGELKYAF